MIISIILITIFTFVWVPIGGSIMDYYFGGYCTTQYVDQGLVFMLFWILLGMGITVLIAYRYEVWID